MSDSGWDAYWALRDQYQGSPGEVVEVNEDMRITSRREVFTCSHCYALVEETYLDSHLAYHIERMADNL